MLFYILEYHSISPTKEFDENAEGLTTITDNNTSSIGTITDKVVYCLDIGDDEYAIGISQRLRIVLKKEDVSDKYTDLIMPLYNNGWVNFFVYDVEKNKTREVHDRFAISLLTTPRKSNIIFLSHKGHHRIGKVENKFVLNIVRNGTYHALAPKPETLYWYTLHVPIVSYKSEIHILNNVLQALKYMYTNKRVVYNNTLGIYNGFLDPYSFNIGFEEPRAMLEMILALGKDHPHFGDIYDQVKKTAETAVKDDIELLYKIATIYDIHKFIKSIYKEYNESYSNVMKEYFEAIFKNRVPEKSPIEITIIDFESKYKKKIED